MTKDELMDFIPYLTMGTGLTIVLLSVAELVTQ